LPSPSPLVGVTDRDGTPVIEALPSPGVTSAIPASEAVHVAWAHMPSYVKPSSVVADFGMTEGHPAWFVVFDGICIPRPGGPPDQSPQQFGIREETVEIDAATGDWIDTYWNR